MPLFVSPSTSSSLASPADAVSKMYPDFSSLQLPWYHPTCNLWHLLPVLLKSFLAENRICTVALPQLLFMNRRSNLYRIQIKCHTLAEESLNGILFYSQQN